MIYERIATSGAKTTIAIKHIEVVRLKDFGLEIIVNGEIYMFVFDGTCEALENYEHILKLMSEG